MVNFRPKMVLRISCDTTVVLVVDMQEKLLKAIDRAQEVAARVGVLVDGAKVLGVPLLCTEQYPAGLGQTIKELQSKLGQEVTRHEKMRFSALIEPIQRELERLKKRTVIVCGIETHVCVLQTCLDLLSAGYETAVAIDAVGSRRSEDREAAIQRMIGAGAAPTTVESALLEMVGEAGGGVFKAMLPLIK